jgi:hypothetical protein
MLAAQLGRYRRRLATKWSQLTGAQLLAVVAVGQRPFAKPTPLAHALLEILLDLPARGGRSSPWGRSAAWSPCAGCPSRR